MNPRLQLRTREEYVNWLSNLSLAPADWMLKVLEVNYACSQDPGSAWIPVDVPACQVKSALSLGVDGQPVKTITIEEARSMLDSEPSANLVLDVRNPDEYTGELGHIRGKFADSGCPTGPPIWTNYRNSGNARSSASAKQEGGRIRLPVF